MAKKNKEQVPNVNSVANRDIIQRLNFLYQASTYLNTLPGPSEPNDPTAPSNSRATKRKRTQRTMSTKDLSRSYLRSMKIVGQKTTVKMDPTVKRTLCNTCDTVLVPGTTASVRIKRSSSHGHAVTYTCLACKSSRRIPAPPTLHLEPELASEGQPAPVDEPAPVSIQIDHKKQRKIPPIPRLPPLFARAVGHVVFRGNEKLEEDESMGGSFVM